MGLLDLPAPLLNAVDGWLSALPVALRLALWGALCGAGSMALYRWVSPQQRIAEGKREQLAARRRLDAFDGPMADAGPLIREMLGSALRQVGRVTGPAVLASLPLLFILVWISTAYGYAFPEGAPSTATEPAGIDVHWNDNSPNAPRVELQEPGGDWKAAIVLTAPVPVVEKRHGWNLLVGNPAGYLPQDAPLQRLRIDLPAIECLPFGPAWLRGWEVTFFTSLLVVSLLLKRLLNIH